MPAQSLLERIADGGALGDGEHATFEAELNAAIVGAGGQGGQRPAAVEAGDLGELAARTGAARQQLAPSGRRSGLSRARTLRASAPSRTWSSSSPP
jgi:hypothetical protein